MLHRVGWAFERRQRASFLASTFLFYTFTPLPSRTHVPDDLGKTSGPPHGAGPAVLRCRQKLDHLAAAIFSASSDGGVGVVEQVCGRPLIHVALGLDSFGGI